MISQIHSLSMNWLESTVIETEVDINNWLPAFTIVWLPDQWVQESKERLRSAMKSSNMKLSSKRITVNLAPANIKKSWPSFDLPIAIWILQNDWWIESTPLMKDSLFVWELALDWKLRAVSSILPMTIWAKELWYKRIFVPKPNAIEAAIIPWIDIIAIESLSEIADILNWNCPLHTQAPISLQDIPNWQTKNMGDFRYIIGQENAKRALEIAAAGWHNLIMEWPPWSGKTMLAKAFSTILPSLSIDECIEISRIYSISWLLTEKQPLINYRPYRSVHHTASGVSIIWWWRNANPWEISLAHKWVLFLDEILEFNKGVLEVLRQPLEDWSITVTRVNACYEYPANFTLIWALNPCPCWYLTDTDRECSCSKKQIANYRGRLSWPLLDRIDLSIDVPRVDTKSFSTKNDYSNIETSVEIQKRVEKARSIQQKRLIGNWISSNSEMWSKEIRLYCKISPESEQVLQKAVETLKLSARSYFRVLKLARTIADLANSEGISTSHLLEALSFRRDESSK